MKYDTVKPVAFKRVLQSLGLLSSVLWVCASLASDSTNNPATKTGEPIHFKPVQARFIAALGDGQASSGSGAENWGVWNVDPGPRGVWLRDYKWLKARNGDAPAGWKFDPDSWWVDENGLLMEKPDFPLPAGHYLVTGEREVITMLTVFEADADGRKRWQLAENAKLEDITHLPCRSAKYTPLTDNNSDNNSGEQNCSPAQAPLTAFKVPPGSVMPDIPGCHRQDYRVLIVIGMPVDNDV